MPEKAGEGRLFPLAPLVLLAALLAMGCGTEVELRPSIVLIVVDTLRADAVSAYGEVQGTTPFLDSLAAQGIRYTRAYAPSSWTIPSHASLFTGLGIARHHVGMRGRLSLPEEFVTLAERFRGAGYETAAFSENMLVSDVFHLLQGFRYKRFSHVYRKEDGATQNVVGVVEPALLIPEWLEGRTPGEPFFLFVNLFDPHSPYTVRDDNPYVVRDAGPEEMRRYAGKPERLLCGALPSPRERDILHGLYLGDVAEADRKIARIFSDLERMSGASRIISVVTSDHGELFGEGNLLGHEFNLRQGALHVPLIVNGLDAPPAVVDVPVALTDIAVSLLDWAGIDAGGALDGHPLPVSSSERSEPRAILSAYSDSFEIDPEQWEGIIESVGKDVPRRECGPGDKVFGTMASIIEYPFKYLWFERYESELYDLSWDPDERSDQWANRPDMAERFDARIAPFLDAAWLTRAPDVEVKGIGDEAAEALHSLGYVD